jgi:two-component system, OmpR family, sensor histidine kinase MprB
VSLRARLTLMSALIVGVILAAASVICFIVIRSELRGQVDDQLRSQARLVRDAPFDNISSRRLPAPPRRTGGGAPFVQLLSPTGRATQPLDENLTLPVNAADRAVAAGTRSSEIRDERADGIHLRVLTVRLSPRGALQLARSLESVDAVLSRLRLVLAVLVLGGTVVAAVLSRLSSRPVIAPITSLTDTAAHIEATGDLGRRIQDGGRDEVGRMASSFNAMLQRVQLSQDALEQSTRTQRQLVADASHELRTPITSLRTNVEVLRAEAVLDDEQRRALLSDIVDQTDELTSLVGDLIELARGDEPQGDAEDVNLAAIVRESLTRMQRHAPDIPVREDLEPWPMSGSRERLARAVNNILDNAAKFTPPEMKVEVELHGGRLSVRDHGPGVPADDLPHIFDRFFRARNAYEYSGSGLGLAIAKQVVEAHGGEATAQLADGGGLIVTLRFP